MTSGKVGLPAGTGGSASLRVHPLRLALIVSVAYLVISLIYIVISGQIAARLSQSIGDLEAVERTKGSIFVATSAILLFGLCYGLFRNIANRERELAEFRSGMIAAERRAAAGLFASSVAHDMNNVISIVDYATKNLVSDQGRIDGETLGDLRQANSDLRKLSNLLGRASGRNLGESETDFDLAVTLRETVELARTHRKVSFCRFGVETPESVPFRGIPVLIHQMLLNLVINAAEATDQSGTITVKLTGTGSDAVIEVHDNGPGVPENQRETIMEPFFTTKDGGSGLGLLSVKVCADAHHGNIQIERSHLGGACFRIRLRNPRGQSSRPPVRQETPSTPAYAPGA